MQRVFSTTLLVCICIFASACGEHPGGPCTDCLLTPQQIEQVTSSKQMTSSQMDAAPPKPHMACVGTATPCALYTDTTHCAAVHGCQADYAFCRAKSCRAYNDATSCYQNRCRWRFACGGEALTCYQANKTQCQRQAGCTWLEDTGVCSGVARSCASFHEPKSCGAQAGCGMLRGCAESRVAPSCLHNTNEAECTVNNACTWEPPSCTGTPAACGTNTNEASCERASGCTWQLTL